MRLELKDISDSELRQDYSCQVTDFPLLVELQGREAIRFVDALCFSLRLQKTGQIVEVDGHFAAQATFSYGHCLQTFQHQLAADFSLTYTPLVDTGSSVDAEEIELDAEQLGLVYYKNETIDLLQPLQEQVLMSLPIAPVCREDCRGLCPECGCDLNSQTCNCEKKPFNNKFTALTGLKLDSSD